MLSHSELGASIPPARVDCEIPRRSTMFTGFHQGRRGLAESVVRWIAGRLSATERMRWKTSGGSWPTPQQRVSPYLYGVELQLTTCKVKGQAKSVDEQQVCLWIKSRVACRLP